MRSRVRGRRVAWLLASALPLVAQDDLSMRENLRMIDEQQQNSYYNRQVIEIATPDKLMRLLGSSSVHRSRNGTARLRRLKSWSSPLAVEDQHDSNEQKDQWKNYATEKRAREHSMTTTVLNVSLPLFDGMDQDDDVCPGTSFWDAISQISDGGWDHSTDHTTVSLVDEESAQAAQNSSEPLRTNNSSSIQDHEEIKVEEDVAAGTPDTPSLQPVEEAKLYRVDYASKSAGALVLESSENFQGTSNLLTSDQDAYAIVPCEEPNKSVVIGLSEDILVKQVVLVNYERYSSHVKKFQVQGSMTMGNWRDFGTFNASRKGQTNNNGKQTFELEKPAWARYLKFQFLTHHGNEYYCTVSQISVHGSTMLQGFHEQWEETNQEEVQNIAIAPPVNTLKSAEKTELDTVATCVTPLNSPCPNVLDFAAVAASYSSSNALPAIHVASINLVSRFKVHANTQERYSLLRRAVLSRLTTPKQRTCVVRNPPAATMRKGVWSLVERCDAPRILTIRKLLASLDIEPDKTVEDIVVKLVDTKEETKAVTSDKISSERLPNEKLPVKPIPHDARKEDNEDVVQNLESQENQEVVVSGPSTDIVPEKADYFAETGLAFAKALERLPSSRCLLDLDFPNFKTKFVNSKIAGSSGSGSAQVNSPMEPIFKKLTDEIKALQASVSIHDLYAKESIICYQRVVMELMLEMESIRCDQEARILKLEHDSRRSSRFLFLNKLWGWIFRVGRTIVWWALEGLRSIGALLIPLSMITSRWMRTLTDPLQPYLTQLSCSMLRYISIAYDSITACLMLPGTSAQLSMPYFCKL